MDQATRHITIVVGTILLIYTCLTIQRNDTWSANRLLWADVVAKSPHLPAGHNNLGRDYHISGNYQAAFREYQKAASLASLRMNRLPRDYRNVDVLASAQSNLGLLLMQTGDVKNAELAFHGALSLITGFGPAVVGLSEVLIVDERYAEAVTVIDDALIEQNFGGTFDGIGGVSHLYQNKGIAMALQGDCLNANMNFDKARQMDPDLIPLHCP